MDGSGDLSPPKRTFFRSLQGSSTKLEKPAMETGPPPNFSLINTHRYSTTAVQSPAAVQSIVSFATSSDWTAGAREPGR